jgi:hypothetical protein
LRTDVIVDAANTALKMGGGKSEDITDRTYEQMSLYDG